jgi:hypothetical protein
MQFCTGHVVEPLRQSPRSGALWVFGAVARDVSARKVLANLPWHEELRMGEVGLGFSPDGRLLAAPYGEMVRVLDVASMTVALDLEGPSENSATNNGYNNYNIL